MESGDTLQFLGSVGQAIYADLLLSCDNAFVIALVSRGLPTPFRRRAIVLGIAAAVVFRIVLTVTLTLVLAIPLLRLAGAAMLALVGIKLIADDLGGADEGAVEEAVPNLWAAIRMIIVADAAMSLDNMLAIIGVAHGNFAVIAIGLIFSVPPLFLGSLAINALIDRYPVLLTAGAALLGWIAGGLAISDPLIADWVRSDFPALAVFAPAIGAFYVPLQGTIAKRSRVQREARQSGAPAVADADAANRVSAETPLEPKKAARSKPRFWRRIVPESRIVAARLTIEIVAFAAAGILVGGGRSELVFCALAFAAALVHAYFAINRWEPLRLRPLAHWHEALALFCLSAIFFWLAP